MINDRSERVLVADDHPSIRRMHAASLKKEDIEQPMGATDARHSPSVGGSTPLPIPTSDEARKSPFRATDPSFQAVTHCYSAQF